MKNLFVFLILFASSCFEEPKKDIFEGQNLSYEQKGKVLYNKHCLSCHGPQAKGTGMAPFKLFDQEIVSDELAFAKLLKNGREGTMMKSFEDVLTEEYMYYVRDYLLSLRNEIIPTPIPSSHQ